MLRNGTSILLIGICLFMQYAKQFAYLECKIENISSKTPVCDCEKKYDNELNKDGQQLPQQKSHVHLLLDEYDVPGKNFMNAITNYQSNKYLNRNISSLSSFDGTVFHPPQL